MNKILKSKRRDKIKMMNIHNTHSNSPSSCCFNFGSCCCCCFVCCWLLTIFLARSLVVDIFWLISVYVSRKANKKPPTIIIYANTQNNDDGVERKKNSTVAKWKMSVHCLCRKRIFVAFVIFNARKKKLRFECVCVLFSRLIIYRVSNQANMSPRRLLFLQGNWTGGGRELIILLTIFSHAVCRNGGGGGEQWSTKHTSCVVWVKQNSRWKLSLGLGQGLPLVCPSDSMCTISMSSVANYHFPCLFVTVPRWKQNFSNISFLLWLLLYQMAGLHCSHSNYVICVRFGVFLVMFRAQRGAYN